MSTNHLIIITTEFLNKLKENNGSLTFCYTINQNIDNLGKILSSRYKIDYLIKHSSFVEKAIRDFFEPIYKLDIKLSSKNEKLLIDITVLQGGESNITDFIKSIIYNLLEIKNDFLKIKSENNLINITNPLRDKIYSLITKDSQKESLKIAIKEAFELDNKDLIIFFANKIVIKKFSLKGYERRFNGIASDDLIELRAKIFPNSDKVKKLMILVVKSAIKEDLSFDKISPAQFLTTSVKIFQKYLFKELMKLLDNKDNILIEGFGNYIFREYFDFTYSVFNRLLLDAVMLKDTNAQRFIQYFNGDIDLEPDGSRYERPSIIDDESNKIHPITIVSIAIQHKNNLMVINKHDKKIVELENEIKKLNTATEQLLDEERLISADIEKLTTSITMIDKDSVELENSLMHSKDLDEKSKSELSQKLKLNRDNIIKLNNKKLELSEKLNVFKLKISNLSTTQQKSIKTLYDENKRRAKVIKSQQQVTLKYKTFELALSKTIKLKRKKIL